MSKRTLTTLSLVQRVEVIRLLDQNETQVSLADKFKVGQAVISRIKRDKEKILNDWQKNFNPDRKRKRTGQAGDVDEALLQWFSQARSRQIPVNGPLLKEKATKLATELGLLNFTPSNGWLERWKDRYNITFKKQHGEKQDADDVGAESWVTDVLPGIIKDYIPSNIFNVDETGLYWKAIPDGTFSFKTSEVSGAKVSKDRITVVLAANMDGSEKLEPLVIGKSKNPRCFKNVKHLPVAYNANSNAWMTGVIWEQWLITVDRKMKIQKRNIVMFCDNCGAHTDNVRLTNVKLVFLPPNTTSLIQPMDQGIIANFKKNYRSMILRHLVALIDGGIEGRAAELSRRVSLLEALHMLRQAWNKISSTTISNCYKRANFVKDSTDVDEDSRGDDAIIYIPQEMKIADFHSYVSIDDELPTHGEQSISSIAASCNSQRQLDHSAVVQEDENDDNEQALPTFGETLYALDKIRTYMEANGCTSYDCLHELENSIHVLNNKTKVQTSIKDFFSTA